MAGRDVVASVTGWSRVDRSLDPAIPGCFHHQRVVSCAKQDDHVQIRAIDNGKHYAPDADFGISIAGVDLDIGLSSVASLDDETIVTRAEVIVAVDVAEIPEQAARGGTVPDCAVDHVVTGAGVNLYVRISTARSN